MTIEIDGTGPAKTLNGRLTLWLCRVAALALFGLGLFYWVRLVGIYGGSLWRFDLMPAQWKTAVAALAVLCPVAGVGLWMAVSWGVVVWVIVALVEAGIACGFGAEGQANGAIAIAHGVGIVLFAGLRLNAWLGGRRAAKV
jgi:hypothetical protein